MISRPSRPSRPTRTRALAIAIALVLVAVVAGCSTNGGDDTEKTTTTAEKTTTTASSTTEGSASSTTAAGAGGEATMKPADGWTELDASSLPQAVVVAYGAPDASATFRDNVNLIVEEGKADDLDDYWAASEEGLDTLSNAKDIEAKSDTEVDGHPAYQKVWTAQTSGRQLQFWSVLTVVDGDGYVFTYTATPDTFDDHRADAKEMFDSIVLPG